MSYNGESLISTPGDTRWFQHDRFGMFIHWGLYALPARHEWIKTYEQISEAKYDTYFRYFDPDLYDPRDWARRARLAGMTYAVFTAKHHEGFCMWDTRLSEYSCMHTGPRRDLLREFVDAFRAEGLRIGFYYSLIDWHHPDFTLDMLHPRRNEPDAERWNERRDMGRYCAYMQGQIRELLSNYGPIDIFWLDFSYAERACDPPQATWQKGKGKEDWRAEELIALARSLQPQILINNRSEIEQDIWTPEQYQPREWLRHEKTGELLVWEACQTFSGSWGYHRDEMEWKSPRMLIEMLINTVSLGGNLLMNVGPTARGAFDERAKEALEAYRRWMHYHSRSIYGCTMSSFTAPQDCRYTQNGDRLYLHLFAYPFRDIALQGLCGRIDYAQFLHDGSEVLIASEHPLWNDNFKSEDVVLRLPTLKPNVEVPVIELFLKAEAQ